MRGLGRGGLAVGLAVGRSTGPSSGRGLGGVGLGASRAAGALGDSSGPRPPKSSPGPLGVRWRNPSGNGMRDSRGRAAGSALGSPEPLSGGRSEPPAEADPGDTVGLLTAGDSVCDPPSSGDEELTDDLSRGVWVPNENHPDTVRLERASAKGAAFKSPKPRAFPERAAAAGTSRRCVPASAMCSVLRLAGKSTHLTLQRPHKRRGSTGPDPAGEGASRG
jgi:hypothetical protein